MNEVDLSPAFLFSVFVFGMILQSFYMLSGRWRKGDEVKVFASFAFGLLGMLPGDGEEIYNLPFHLFVSCVCAAIMFVYIFRKRLLVRVGGQILIVWNALLVAVLIDHFGVWWPMIIVVAILSIPTLINGFSDIDKYFGWQVYFYAWYTVMIVCIGLFQFSFDSLDVFSGGSGIASMPAFDILAAGASFLFLLVNAWYVLALIPITREHQSMENRMKEVRAHMQLLAYGYLWEKDNLVANFILVIFLPIFLLTRYKYHYIDEGTVIYLAMIITAVIGTRKIDQVDSGDGIGSLEGINSKEQTVLEKFSSNMGDS